jgi:uncharacterized HAD superfamily protein
LKSHEIIVITSRPARFKSKTELWIKHHLGIHLEVVHSGDFHNDGRATKAQICKELKIPILLEDAPETAIECANSGINVVLFDQPWNQKVKHKNIIRVKNWLEALKQIEHFKKS